MKSFEYIGNIKLNLKVYSSYYSIETNCHYLYNDLIYFIRSGKNSLENIEISKRYARAAIMILASYLDCLSNLLINEIEDRFKFGIKLKKIIKEDPIYKFGKIYNCLSNNRLSSQLDIQGIKDFYYRVRNQIIVHPPARSIKAGTGVIKGKGLTEDKKVIQYLKLKSPNILSEFTMNDIIEIYNEVKIFLKEYYKLIIDDIPKNFLEQFFHLEEV